MKAVMGELKGKADGKVINQVVARLCQWRFWNRYGTTEMGKCGEGKMKIR